MRSIGAALLAAAIAGCGPATVALVPPPQSPPAEPAIAPPAPVIALASPAPSCARRAESARLVPLERTFAGATVALGRLGGRTLAYVADEDEQAVRTVDLESRAELAITPLGATPGQLLILADGRVAVALRSAARIAVLEPAEDPGAPLDLRCSVDAPTEPVGLAATPDGARLLVTSRWAHALTAYDAASLARLFAIALPRDPVGIVTSDDGARAFVSHVVGTRLSVVDLAAATASTVDLHQLELATAFNGNPAAKWSTGQGYTLVRTANGRILAPEILAKPRPEDGAIPTGYGAGNAPSQIGDVAVIDAKSLRVQTTPVLDFVSHADCLLPRAAALDEAGGRLLVACLGADAVIAYDATRPLPHLAPVRRWSVPVGPAGIAVDAAARRAVVWSPFARTMSLIALGAPFALPVTFALPRHAAAMDARLDLGRRLFHGAGNLRIAGDGRACASCHPDGRDDGLTWSTPDGPRQTPMLAGRLGDTAPYGWDGANPSLHDHVRRTFRRLSGQGLAAPEFEALLAYVAHLEMPSDSVAPSPAEARGDALFHSSETGCAGCHADARTADGARHDVASLAKGDRRGAFFDTPSLRFVGRSAPYFHDGRYASLGELLRGADGTMGHTGHLGPDDLAALEAYLESL